MPPSGPRDGRSEMMSMSPKNQANGAQRARSFVASVSLVVAMSVGCGADANLGVVAPELVDPTFPGLPTGNILAATSAGALPGTMDVSARGSLTYEIPIATPAGRMGLQPSLALSYDSSGGNGPLGMGFELAGAPGTVSRCAIPDTVPATGPAIPSGSEERNK